MLPLCACGEAAELSLAQCRAGIPTKPSPTTRLRANMNIAMAKAGPLDKMPLSAAGIESAVASGASRWCHRSKAWH